MYKSKILSLIIITFLAAVLVDSVRGQTAESAKIDSLIKPYVKAGHFSGIVLAEKDGRVIYERAFGVANADFDIPNNLDTRIGIASINKSMTLIVLLRLVEEKKITLDDKLSKYIPDFPRGDEITIELLARHRAGIPHRVMPPEMEAVPHTSEEMVEKIKQAELVFTPGEKRLYSSAGFTVLARTLEIASGKPFAQLLDEYVFGPAGMTDTLDFDGVRIIERGARDYLLAPSGYINAALKDYSFLVGAGSVVSTARDLYRFGIAVVNGKYGELVRKNLVDEGVFTSNGRTNGHRANIRIDRSNKYGYVLLSNLASGANDQIVAGLRKILQDGEQPRSNVLSPRIIPNPNKNIKEFLGRYNREGATGSGFDLIFKNDRFFAGDIPLYPIRKDCFFDYKFYGEVCFVRDTAGRIKHISWASPGITSTWVKQPPE